MWFLIPSIAPGLSHTICWYGLDWLWNDRYPQQCSILGNPSFWWLGRSLTYACWTQEVFWGTPVQGTWSIWYPGTLSTRLSHTGMSTFFFGVFQSECRHRLSKEGQVDPILSLVKLHILTFIAMHVSKVAGRLQLSAAKSGRIGPSTKAQIGLMPYVVPLAFRFDT